MENVEYARLLEETADLMEIASEDGFRIRSYRNAAAAIEGLTERLEDILKDANRRVTDVPGIGKGIASALTEIDERGSFERRDQLLEKYPPTALEMLKIQGIGPKAVALIIEHFRCSTLDGLERLAKEGKLRDLPRMGAKLEEKVLRSIALVPAALGPIPAELRDRRRARVERSSPAKRRHASGGRRQRAARPRNRRRRRSAGHRRRRGEDHSELRHASASERSAGQGREQGEREGRARRLAGRPARAARRELRRGAAVLHGQQEPQRRAPAARARRWATR